MGRPRTEDTTTFSLRLPNSLIHSIDENATRLGLTRTEYIRSWLPDTHTRVAAKAHEAAESNGR